MVGEIAAARIESEKGSFITLAKQMWDTPETAFNEVNACKWTADLLMKYGFETKIGYANLPTCVMGKWGKGHPIIGILGELDALPGLSQKIQTVQEPVAIDAPGHGCGHNLLNAASLAATVGIKAELEERNLTGTIIFYGCPAEEVLTGKAFMAREGAFRELDCAIAWHGNRRNAVETANCNGVNSAVFRFHGTTAHAGSNPWDGRSALDAAELMNVGTNYLREHVTPDVRMHYVYQQAGTAPNIVPDEASVWYYVRGGSRQTIENTYARLVRVAEGAAHMTDTNLEVEFMGGCYNTLHNRYLGDLAYRTMKEVKIPEWTAEEKKFAQELNAKSPRLAEIQKLGWLEDGPLHTSVADNHWDGEIGGGSTDVADVQHICPTVAFYTATYNLAGVGHSWQITACAGMTIGFKGMLHGANVMATLAMKLYTDPIHLKNAKDEFDRAMNGTAYVCPIPKDIPIPQPQTYNLRQTR